MKKSSSYITAGSESQSLYPLVTTRPIPYLHQTSSVLRKSPLELLSVLLE